MTPVDRVRTARLASLRRLTELLAAAAVVAVGLGQPLAAIPVAYEGFYGRYLLAPEGAFEAVLPLAGVVEVIRDRSELQVLRPGEPPTRFVPAGRHRFVAPRTAETLSFDVVGGRVRSAYLNRDSTSALVPVRAWQASLLRVGHRLGAAWYDVLEMGRMLVPF